MDEKKATRLVQRKKIGPTTAHCRKQERTETERRSTAHTLAGPALAALDTLWLDPAGAPRVAVCGGPSHLVSPPAAADWNTRSSQLERHPARHGTGDCSRPNWRVRSGGRPHRDKRRSLHSDRPAMCDDVALHRR
jgi:hypothetical protein